MTAPRLLAAALIAGPLLLAGPPARGEPPVGLYVGAGAGANLWEEQASGGLRVEAENPGVVAVGTLGWGFGNGWRLELEGSWRENAVDRIASFGAGVGTSGTVRTYGVMVNALFDFDMSSFGLPPTLVAPYVGGGIGYGWLELDGAALAAGEGVTSRYRIDDRDGQFAYQAIAGLAWDLGTLVPGLALTTEYRFYGTLEQTVTVTRLSGPAVAGVPDRLKLDNANHAALLGLRLALNPPAPPVPAAPPAAAPAPARSYLVFFDWDRADLTERARQIIAEAAQNARRVATTRIEVSGHADRSGAPQYNLALSRRRAEAVAEELVRQGIRRDEIGLSFFGESQPLVPTADGAREPQNRRVEIVLR